MIFVKQGLTFLFFCASFGKRCERVLLPLGEGGAAERKPDRAQPQEKRRMRAGMRNMPALTRRFSLGFALSGSGASRRHPLPEGALHKKCWAVIDRPYSLGYATVGALYERP